MIKRQIRTNGNRGWNAWRVLFAVYAQRQEAAPDWLLEAVR